MPVEGWSGLVERLCVGCLETTLHDAGMDGDWIILRCQRCKRESALYKTRKPSRGTPAKK